MAVETTDAGGAQSGHRRVSEIVKSLATVSTAITLPNGVVLQSNDPVFDRLLTLAMGASHGLKAMQCKYSSYHPLRNQCPEPEMLKKGTFASPLKDGQGGRGEAIICMWES